MRELIHGLQRQQGITTLVVTHDQEEAVMLADQLAVIFDGVLQQVAAPRVFYEQPANLEVARFFGANNLLAGVVRGGAIQTDLGSFRVERNHLAPGPVQLAIRPENIRILSGSSIIAGRTSGENTVDGQVQSCAFTGVRSRLKVRVMQQTFDVIVDADAAGHYREGDRLQLYLPPEKLWAFY
jgi:iron(III) transport system ATP-binding protein